jgi:hypothetical protein
LVGVGTRFSVERMKDCFQANNYKKMVGQLVKIIFKSQEFFDPRIGEYRTFNIIQKLELINQ